MQTKQNKSSIILFNFAYFQLNKIIKQNYHTLSLFFFKINHTQIDDQLRLDSLRSWSELTDLSGELQKLNAGHFPLSLNQTAGASPCLHAADYMRR